MSLKWAIKVFKKIADGFASLPVGDKSGSLVNWGLQRVWRERMLKEEIEEDILLPFTSVMEVTSGAIKIILKFRDYKSNKSTN
jgi:hypothetical protein